MKNTKLTLVTLIIAAAAFFSFTVFQGAAIKGTVTPADKAVRAWAMSPTDTLHAKVENGAFEIKDAKAGTYAIVIEAIEPFAHTRKQDAVTVAEGEIADAGEIKLQPKNGN
jgi:hypothetical protein